MLTHVDPWLLVLLKESTAVPADRSCPGFSNPVVGGESPRSAPRATLRDSETTNQRFRFYVMFPYYSIAVSRSPDF
jgi:hypothetical protein